MIHVGVKVEDPNARPETTLLAYLRNTLGLCGTKLGCGEGGCGACTVMLSQYRVVSRESSESSISARNLKSSCTIHYSINT